ncbi:type II secretion system minor pseudopilin GspI [Solimonas soli]|uniref:type II secretion system minor pseudopilin GspI n=1 Tax=Solimonas soli TaxID=413479 RepID=UPI000481FCD1|nr:type II secretion system minor pseudopilin GspI [Solimonas soli]
MSARAARGFTLIEMLAAVAVVAIAMGAIIAGMARYTDNASYLRQKTVALWVAHNRMTELELQRGWPDAGKSNGEVEMAGTRWRWDAEVLATQDPHLRRVNLSVRRVDPKATASALDKQTPLAHLSAFLADAGRK